MSFMVAQRTGLPGLRNKTNPKPPSNEFHLSKNYVQVGEEGFATHGNSIKVAKFHGEKNTDLATHDRESVLIQ